jgi:hypothetical protein
MKSESRSAVGEAPKKQVMSWRKEEYCKRKKCGQRLFPPDFLNMDMTSRSKIVAYCGISLMSWYNIHSVNFFIKFYE